MKRFLICVLIQLALVACSVSTPPPATPTLSPTPQFTPSPAPTATLTPIPTPTAPPPAMGADGLPLFPENAQSGSIGISLSFSQATLNALGVSGVQFPPAVMDDLKQGLTGQWLWLLGADGYGHVDPNSFSSLKKVNAAKPGMRIWLCKQLHQNFGLQTEVDLRVVLQTEFEALQNDYQARKDGCAFTTRYKSLSYGFTESEGMIFAEKNKFTYVMYVPTGFISFRQPKDAASTVALIVYALTQGTKWTIGVDVADYNNQHGNRNFEFRRKYSRNFASIDRFYVGGIRDQAFSDKEWVSKEAILGWCFFDINVDGVANCKEGIEHWNFTLTP